MAKKTIALFFLLALALAQTASAGTDINQTRAGLFAYYKLTSNEVNLTRLGSETGLWTCGAPTADPHYIEGYVCVDNNYVGSTSGTYNKVRLRVKRDGWIMAYVYNDERPNLAGLIYWGTHKDYCYCSSCARNYEYKANDTVLGEAIRMAMATASINEAYNRDSMLYWHFQKPGAKRIRIFGNGKNDYYGNDDYSYAIGTQLDPTLGAYMSYNMGNYYGDNYVAFSGLTSWNSGQKTANTFYIEDLTARQYRDGQPNFITNYEHYNYYENTVSGMFVIA